MANYIHLAHVEIDEWPCSMNAGVLMEFMGDSKYLQLRVYVWFSVLSGIWYDLRYFWMNMVSSFVKKSLSKKFFSDKGVSF